MTTGSEPLTPTLPELVRRAAARYGSKTAVVDGERSASFSDVEQRSNALAHALMTLCRGPGARVAVLMPNQLETVECDFAIAKAGMVRVPINTRLTQDEREYLLADSGAEIVIHAAGLTDSVMEARAAVPTIRAGVAVGGAAPGSLRYDDVVGNGAATPPRLVHAPEAPSYMLYTSGTTGRPKGAVSTNRGRLSAMVTTLAQEQSIRPGDVMVHMASTAHGSGAKVLPYFVSGATNRMERKWDPDLLLDLAARGEATASFMVPTMVSALAEAAAGRTHRPETSSLRTVVYGGAPIPPAHLRRALDALGNVLVQVYGSAEAPHAILLLDQNDHALGLEDERLLASAGGETMLCAVRLTDPDGCAVERPAVNGELWVRGPTVMAGYWNNDDATAAVIHDGWYRTGDVAHVDERGRYFIVDRVRDVIISGGYNVYPAEVEAVIAQLPGVRHVAVIGVPDDTWGEAVRAVVAPHAGAHVTPQAVVEHCQRSLAGYKKPRSVEIVDELPIGATGKVQRRALRARYWDGRERRV